VPQFIENSSHKYYVISQITLCGKHASYTIHKCTSVGVTQGSAMFLALRKEMVAQWLGYRSTECRPEFKYLYRVRCWQYHVMAAFRIYF